MSWLPLEKLALKFAPSGLVTSRQGPASKAHRGIGVPVLTDQDVADAYLAGGVLESAAIRAIIARGLVETAYEALDKHVTKLETAAAAGGRAEVGTFDREFLTAAVAPAAYGATAAIVHHRYLLRLAGLSRRGLRQLVSGRLRRGTPHDRLCRP
jgi:DNA-binding GntR family transcriptional regulator